MTKSRLELKSEQDGMGYFYGLYHTDNGDEIARVKHRADIDTLDITKLLPSA